MKLFTFLLAALLCVPAYAQFSRIGDTPTINFSYVATDAEKSNNWEGFALTNMLPVYKASWYKINTDLGVSYQKANDVNSNYAKAVWGFTFWPAAYNAQGFNFSPYARIGVSANSGNTSQQNESYWGYAVEPGVIVRFDKVYGVINYFYENSFNNNDAAFINSGVGTGIGIDFSKNFAVEAKYNMNRGGSFNSNTLLIGGTYKF